MPAAGTVAVSAGPGAETVASRELYSPEEMEVWCHSDTFEEAMTAHAEGCEFPLVWNLWQQVARKVAVPVGLDIYIS